MTIFEVLDREARVRGLSFLVIGGHAVNAYGYARETADVDLATPSSTNRFSAPSRDDGGVDGGFHAQPPDLELPEAPEFVSKPPRLPWLTIFKRSEECLLFKTRRAGFEQRRLETKSTEEFVL